MLLALMPILNIYMSPIPGFAIGDVLLLLCGIALFGKSQRQKLFYWPHNYIIFWVYVSLSFLLSSAGSGNAYRAIIPGGVAFFVFSLKFGLLCNKMDIQLLHKYIKIVAYATIIVFVLQEAYAVATGYRFSGLLPFGQMTDGVDVQYLINIQKYAQRSCSLFREPAHFAQFLIVVLSLDLFLDGKGWKISTFSIICILTLLFLRSGNGLLGLMVVATVKAFAFLRGRRSFYKYAIIILIPVIIAWALPYYMQTEAAQEVMLRTDELSFDAESRSFARTYRGYMVFGALPWYSKILGTDSEGMLEASRSSGLSYMFLGERNSDLYCNGVQQVLLGTGIVGMILLLFFIIPYFNKSSYLGKSSLLGLLALSLVSAMYLSPIMLMAFLIAIEDAKRKKAVIV